MRKCTHKKGGTKKRRETLSACALFAAAVLLLTRRADAASGAASGISLCLSALVPALFPFVVLACGVAESAAGAILSRPFAPLMRRVFRLPAAAAPALFFGMTAGYPVGARIAAGLLRREKLTQEEAGRLLCFCTAPGFAFTVSFVGPLLGSAHTGWLLFAATGAAPLVLGAVLARFAPKYKTPPRPVPENVPSGGGFTEAVRGGVSAMTAMCGFVVVFSVVLSVLRGAGAFRALSALLARLGLPLPLADTLLTFLFEVTAGVQEASFWKLAPQIAAFGLGFGGVCIHAQIFSFFRGQKCPVGKAAYFGMKLLNGVLSAALYRFFAFCFPESVEAAALSGAGMFVPAAGNWAASAALLGASLVFLKSCACQNPEPAKIRFTIREK